MEAVNVISRTAGIAKAVILVAVLLVSGFVAVGETDGYK